MRRKIFLKVMLIIVLAMLTVLLTFKYLKGLNHYVTVYIAKEDIQMYSILKDDDVEEVEIRFEEKVKFFNNAVEDKDALLNMIALQDIKKGTVLVEGDTLLDSKENPEVLLNGRVNMNYFVSSDQRIGFISMDKKHAFGGQLKKGDYIDIIYTSQNDATGGLYTSLLLQHVLVKDVNDNAASDTATDIYLQLSHKDAMLLSIAKYNGQLDLLLSDESNRNNDIIPVLPQDLYIKLLEAGYMLVDENNQEISNTGTHEETDLEKEMAEAELQLTQAFEALNQAKEALKAEQSKQSDESVEEMIRRLESTVNALEITVDENTTILENLEDRMTTGGN